jgi:hypothetical protein
MKLFAIALAMVCGTAALLFGIGFAVSSAFLEHSDAMLSAKALAGLPVLSFPKFLEFLEQQEGRKNLAAGKRTPIYDFSGFQIAWPLMALYGWILLFTVDVITAAFVAAVDTSITAQFPEDVKESVRGAYELALFFTIQLPGMILGAYFVGRLIGTRCSSRGLATVFLVIILYGALDLAIDLNFPDEPWEPSSTLLDLIRFPFLLCASLIGYWRARKYRLSKYLHYLLGFLSPETRDAVIDLAFEEVKKVGSATGSATVRK